MRRVTNTYYETERKYAIEISNAIPVIIEIILKGLIWPIHCYLYDYNPNAVVVGDRQTIPGINATFNGTGDPEACLRLLEILVYKVESWKCNPRPCAIGSFYQPTLPPNMTFYAVGAFIHTLTSIDALQSNGVYVPQYGLSKASEYCRKVNLLCFCLLILATSLLYCKIVKRFELRAPDI